VVEATDTEAAAEVEEEAEASPDLDGVVPEVPKLADGVRLSGDMEESAFVEPQWLAQRDGQFVQLTELLYRVAEQVDGQKNLEQIAEAVGDAIDRDVTAGNVQQLIGEKLIPLGLVPKADGSVARPAGAGQSPLQVNMKMAMVPPTFSHGLGKALSPL
jgi:putative peptide zinc metalloprotease protein